jgi:hypothetical protein
MEITLSADISNQFAGFIFRHLLAKALIVMMMPSYPFNYRNIITVNLDNELGT